MEKEKYERTEIDIFKFQTEDVIMTSGIDYEDDDLQISNRGRYHDKRN